MFLKNSREKNNVYGNLFPISFHYRIVGASGKNYHPNTNTNI